MNNSAGKGDEMNNEHIEVNEAKLVLNKIKSTWADIAAHPDRLTDLSEQKVIFAAGGGLVTLFGNDDSEIWKSMVNQAVDGRIQVAGIDFYVEDLVRMGEFYRFLKTRYRYNFHCIDERLEGNENHLDKEVHAACGACAAVGIAARLDNVEDKLLDELGQQAKKEIYRDMPNHDSIVILVDYAGADVVLGSARDELKQKRALPFNVSIPINKVEEWVQETNIDPSALMSTLIQWNVQVARNIIGGDHNKLRDLANQVIIVADVRNVQPSGLIQQATGLLKNVPHGEIYSIS